MAKQVTIKTFTGTVDVDAYVCKDGVIAVHEAIGEPGYAISHLPTGYSILRRKILSRPKAIRVAKMISEITDWSNLPTYKRHGLIKVSKKTKREIEPKLREIYEREVNP